MSKSDIPAYTQCQFRNYAGDGYYVKLDSESFWHGYADPPKTIQDEYVGNFTHNADAEGSLAGVAYTLVTNKGDTLKWVTAWSNKEEVANKVYTQIVAANTNIDWINFKTQHANSGSQSSDHNKFGYSSEATIDQNSGMPKLISTLKSAE